MEIRRLKKYGNRPEGITPSAFYIGLCRHSSAFIRVLGGFHTTSIPLLPEQRKKLFEGYMKNAQKATGGIKTAKRYLTAMMSRSIKFKRLLKPFKGGICRRLWGAFGGFTGGMNYA